MVHLWLAITSRPKDDHAQNGLRHNTPVAAHFKLPDVKAISKRGMTQHGRRTAQVCSAFGCFVCVKSDDQIIREIRISGNRILTPVRPRMQAAGLQCLKLQIAVASPDPQTRAFPGTQVSQKIRSPDEVKKRHSR